VFRHSSSEVDYIELKPKAEQDTRSGEIIKFQATFKPNDLAVITEDSNQPLLIRVAKFLSA
jgi:hypothetical protein